MTIETTGGAADPSGDGRMSRQRKRFAVLGLSRGKGLETVSRALGVIAATLSGWRDASLAANKASLNSRPAECEAFKSERPKAMWGTDLTTTITGEGQPAVCVAVDLCSAERFIRTPKEDLLRVRTFDTVEDLRQALRAFRATCNATWLIERHGFRSPGTVRPGQLSTAALAA